MCWMFDESGISALVALEPNLIWLDRVPFKEPHQTNLERFQQIA